MPYLKRSGEPDLHYVIDDYTDPWRNAPHIILQHGYGRSSRFWYSWVPYLSRFYKVVRPDLRGLGESSANFDLERDFTVETCVGDLAAIIDHLGAESVHFCGESMGGILGMVLAATHPARVRTLTLVSSPVSLRDASGKLAPSAGADAIQKGGFEAWLDATNRGMRFPPDTDPGLLRWYKEEFLRNRPEVQLAMAKLGERMNAAPFLARIQAPVLGLYPTSGPLTSQEQEKMLTENVRHLRMVHLPSSYHKVQMIFPAACANHLLHFAAQHDGTACHEA